MLSRRAPMPQMQSLIVRVFEGVMVNSREYTWDRKRVEDSDICLRYCRINILFVERTVYDEVCAGVLRTLPPIVYRAASMVFTHNLRAIVKACLIVTLTLQQVVVGAMPALVVSRCGSETLNSEASSAEQKCSGCGHCTVEKADQRCGCCASRTKPSNGTAPVKATSKTVEAAQSCCSAGQQAESQSVALHTSEIKLAEEVRDNIGACDSNQSEHLSTAENRCRCVGGSPNRSTPYRGESRVQKDLTSLRAIAQASMFRVLPSSHVNCTKADSAFHSLSHFAQRHLCVWQL